HRLAQRDRRQSPEHAGEHDALAAEPAGDGSDERHAKPRHHAEGLAGHHGVSVHVEVMSFILALLVFVTNERSGNVTVLKDDRPVTTFAAGTRPRGIVMSPDG